MASEDAASIRDFLDRSFQSVASRHMDLKQREVDTAAAKVDELSKQLQSLWMDNPSPTTTSAKSKERYSLGSVSSQDVLVKAASSLPSSPRKSASWEATESSGYIPFAFASEGPQSAPFYGSASNKSSLGRPISPRPSFFLQPELDRSPLPPAAPPSRPKVMPIPYEPAGHASSPRSLRPGGPSERQYDYKPYGSLGREGSPRTPAGEASGAPQAFFPDRVPSPRPPLPPPYENHNLYPSAPSNFAPFRAQDDLVLRRRGAKSWNESDLDVAYEKKTGHSVGYDRGDAHLGLRQNNPLAPWRESSLDGSIGPSKEGPFGTHSATLPRNYKVFPPASERRPDATSSFRRSLPANPAGTLPRNWQPVSRIPMPPPGPPPGLPQRHKPLPLSMIFRLQNAFWEYGNTGKKFPLGPTPTGSPLLLRSLQKQALPQAFASGQHSPWMAPPPANEGARAAVPVAEPVRNVPIALTEPDPELEGLLLLPGGEASEMESLARPLSPTRLQPVLPPEAQKVPEFEEVARVLADMPRPLKRRGSMEQSPGPALPPTHKKQYQQIISRLFHHQQQQQPRKEETGVPTGEAELAPISEAAEQKAPTPTTALGSSPAPATPTITPPSPLSPPPPESPVALTPLPSPEKRSVLRKISSPRKRLLKKARLNPLVLLLDAALTGELDVVKEAVKELNDPSQPNDEGITALHNAICGANYNIVDFLINIGANVNSPDSHGWTPLHCAASCNDTAICIALIKHGAAIFATTFSDGSMAIEKCDPYREGYSECFSYLADVEQSMGLMNNGAVYALWDYSAEFKDELSFREGEPVTVLRRDGAEEADWWWASLYGQEGYVPKNYFGLFPRVRPQARMA